MMRHVIWPNREDVLVNKLGDVIRADNVPYVNKFDAIACLAELVSAGPRSQAREIAQTAISWLKNGIPGFDPVGDSGPLSRSHVFGMAREDLDPSLWYLVDEIAKKCGDEFLNDLSAWVLQNSIRASNKVLHHAVRIPLWLSMWSFSADIAMSMAFVGIAEAAAQIGAQRKPGDVVAAFRSVVFSELPRAERHEAWLNSTVGEFLLKLWPYRILEFAESADASVRQDIAEVLSAWNQSTIELPASLQQASARLKADCRLRVRTAAAR
jgi:hypothetical protein